MLRIGFDFGRGVAISIGCKQLGYLATAIASKQTVMELVAAAVAPAAAAAAAAVVERRLGGTLADRSPTAHSPRPMRLQHRNSFCFPHHNRITVRISFI
jgi:hypothetical protein